MPRKRTRKTGSADSSVDEDDVVKPDSSGAGPGGEIDTGGDQPPWASPEPSGSSGVKSLDEIKASVGAMTPFTGVLENGERIPVVLNGHGQLVHAKGMKLVTVTCTSFALPGE